MDVKIMIIPGRTVNIDVEEGASVLSACQAAARQRSDIDWVGLAKNRQVRVNGRIFSNVTEYEDSRFSGNIVDTPLAAGSQVMILTKIQGNIPLDVKMITINGEEFTTDGEKTVGEVLDECLGIDCDDVEEASINGRPVDRNDQVNNGDNICYRLVEGVNYESENDGDEDDDEEDFSVEIDGETFDSRLSAIRYILDQTGSSDDDQDILDKVSDVLSEYGY